MTVKEKNPKINWHHYDGAQEIVYVAISYFKPLDQVHT